MSFSIDTIKKRIKDNLKKSGRKEEVDAYLKDAFVKSSCMSLAILIIVYYLYDLQLGLLMFITSFALLFAGKIYRTESKKKEYAKKIEAFLPLAVLELALLLEAGSDFDYAIKKIANGKYGLVSSKYKQLVEEMEKGKSLEEGIRKMNERHQSLSFERANAILKGVYYKGNKEQSIKALKMLGEEILSFQKIEAKEFGGKLIVYSLMFIAVSAIIPALFQSFLIAGTLVFKIDFAPIEVFLIIVLLFPLADILMLLYIKGKTPIHMRLQNA